MPFSVEVEQHLAAVGDWKWLIAFRTSEQTWMLRHRVHQTKLARLSPFLTSPFFLAGAVVVEGLQVTVPLQRSRQNRNQAIDKGAIVMLVRKESLAKAPMD